MPCFLRVALYDLNTAPGPFCVLGITVYFYRDE